MNQEEGNEGQAVNHSLYNLTACYVPLRDTRLLSLCDLHLLPHSWSVPHLPGTPHWPTPNRFTAERAMTGRHLSKQGHEALDKEKQGAVQTDALVTPSLSTYESIGSISTSF